MGSVASEIPSSCDNRRKGKLFGGCIRFKTAALRSSEYPMSHYTTAVAEDGKSWFSDGSFLGKGMILCSEKHVPPSVKNYVRLSR